MPPKVYPPHPTFKSTAERDVFSALLAALSDEDMIFANLRITDSEHEDAEIDFVVLLKENGIAVIEVKGGHITHDGRGWVQSDKRVARYIEPATQAIVGFHALMNYTSPRWSQLPIRSDWLVAFPHSDIVDPGDPALPMSRIIQKSQLPNILSSLKSCVNANLSRAVPSIPGWVDIFAKTLMPIASHRVSPEAVLGNNYEFIRNQTHERAILLDQLSDNSRYYVRGPAGSGKTWLAFEQAKKWTGEGLEVALLTYNDGLTTYFKNKNSELPFEEQISFVGSFNEFAVLIHSDVGHPSHHTDVVDRYRDDLLAKAADLTSEEKFDAFVVDEAEDFLKSWWEALDLSVRENGRLALFGDDQQQIFGFNSVLPNNLAYFRLNENLRNSQQIAEAISHLVDRPIIPRGPHAFDIEYVISESVVEEADRVVSRLTEVELWNPKEIALLTTKRRHELHKTWIDVSTERYWEYLWIGDYVFYCTVAGFKGLEKPVVVLAVDGFHEDADWKDVMYVGISRARDKLIIVADEPTTAKIQALLSGN